MRIIVNGKPEDVQTGRTVHDFLVAHGIDPAGIVLERNGKILPREAFPRTGLETDDTVEIVHFVGGG